MLIVYGCFPTAVAGFSSCDRECIVCKAENIYYLAFFIFWNFLQLTKPYFEV